MQAKQVSMDHLSLTVLPLKDSLDGNEGNMEEIGGSIQD